VERFVSGSRELGEWRRWLMADDKKKKKSLGDVATSAGAGAASGLAAKLKGGTTLEDVGISGPEADIIKKINSANLNELPPSLGADSSFDHFEALANISGTTPPHGSFGRALKDAAPDTGPKQATETFNYEDKIAAWQRAADKSREDLMSSDEWKTAESYKDWGKGIIGIGALAGIPALAVVGMLLSGKGQSKQNRLWQPFQEGLEGLLKDKATQTEVLAKQKDIELSMAAVREAAQSGEGNVEAVMSAERARLKARWGDITDAEINTSFDAAAGGPVTAEGEKEKLEKKGYRTEASKAVSGAEEEITVLKKGSTDTEVIDYMKQGNFAAAANKLFSEELQKTAGSGLDADTALNMRFSLDTPISIADAKDIEGDAKYFHRTGPTDEILKMVLGDNLSPESVKTMGFVTDEEKEKVPMLENSPEAAPMVEHANRALWWMIDKGDWVPVDGGWAFRVPTETKKLTLADRAKGLSKYGGWLNLVDKVWDTVEAPSEIHLYAELESSGFGANLREALRIRAEAMR
jgi:hypothetical protein